jgi:transcriptional regulator with PAS, ATPase and Fis domain/tetratricopeptide (TPR) repeat protein
MKTTSRIDRVRELKQVGLYAEALKNLEVEQVPARFHLTSEVLKAELLETTGDYESARALAANLLKSRLVTNADRAVCEYVLGRVDITLGDIANGVGHFQRSVLRAQEANDIEAEFHARIQLFNILFERTGPDGASLLLSEIRALATKLGDPRCMAKLHLFVAVMEARRGMLCNADRHITVARRLLEHAPHAYYEAFAENVSLGICVVRANFEAAKAHGVRAIQLAEKAGLSGTLRVALGNVGSLHYSLGDFDQAVEYFQKSLIDPSMHRLGLYATGTLEGLAKVRLAQGHLKSCEDLLDRLEASVESENDRLWYVYREAELTRVHLLVKRDSVAEALSKAERVLALATQANDTLTAKRASLTKAELWVRAGDIQSAMGILQNILPTLPSDSPELFAYTEQIFACASVRAGDFGTAGFHRDRALRICGTLRCVATQNAFNELWTNSVANCPNPSNSCETEGSARGALHVRRTLHSLAMAVRHSTRPELVMGELLTLLIDSGAVLSEPVQRPAEEKHPSRSAQHASPDPQMIDEQVLSLRGDSGNVETLILRPRNDVDSVATVCAVRMLVDAIQELQRGQAEREERATLWPVEELAPEDGRSVLTGHMRELMTFARRVAKTDVNVLITGESGTGKEILARAIHDFSNRADRPFVPFNCTAIPRDLLESQLFGYRRGAFTGADRDYDGLIRSARTGTLFLDEVGELGLDLQPKLLRFLESGEIAPLGGTAPLTVDVRIVAATNTNLEDAVRAGRFREDLYYRLNVVRLPIRPLRERRDEIPAFVNNFVARAAEDFKKGHLTVADETMERLLLYRWPGNVRQVQNEVRRMVALAEPNSTLLPGAISDEILGALPVFRRDGVNGSEISVSVYDKLLPTLARVECEMIKAALHKHDGKVNAVAKALGISRKGLYLKRQRFGL